MKKLLSILFLLWVTGGLYAQFIPGVVASSKKVEEEAPLNHIYNGDFAFGSSGWELGSGLVIANNTCYYNGSGYPGLGQRYTNLAFPILAGRSYVLEIEATPDDERGMVLVGIGGRGESSGGIVISDLVVLHEGVNSFFFDVPGDEHQVGLRIIFDPYWGGGYVTNIAIYEDN